jgi:hypothetical protein
MEAILAQVEGCVTLDSLTTRPNGGGHVTRTASRCPARWIEACLRGRSPGKVFSFKQQLTSGPKVAMPSQVRLSVGAVPSVMSPIDTAQKKTYY